MAEVKIIRNADGVLCSSDITVGIGVTSVSFLSDVDCTVCFQNSRVFNRESTGLQGGKLLPLPIEMRATTEFIPVPVGSACQFPPKTGGMHTMSSPGSHTITMG